MKRALLPAPALALLLFAGTSHSANGRRSSDSVQLLPRSPVRQTVLKSGTPALQSPATVLQSWSFDNAQAPDPMGWTAVDVTDMAPYFHVEDFVGMPPGFTPIAGTKSMWLGRLACDSPTDCVLETDGYGNKWEQYFFSQPFTMSSTVPVTITFQLRYDCEQSYDELTLNYAGLDHEPQLLRTWSGTGTESVSETIADGFHDGEITFWFAFKSDVGVSDEDGFFNSLGAATIDNIVVTAGAGTVDSQDFENAADGALYTPDGHWFAGAPPTYGNFAALLDADLALQEDPGYHNSTHVWGFFSGSPDNYACGGHPEQAAVPLTQNVGGILRGMFNELQSPPVSIATIPSGHIPVLSYDAYEDNAQMSHVGHSYGVRSKVGGVWKPWKRSVGVYNNPSKAWNTRVFNLNQLIPAGTTDIQVAIIARDVCPLFCDVGNPVTCHSHSPMIDNVSVLDSNTNPSGGPVTVSPVDGTTGTTPVSVTFGSVTSAGETTLSTSPAGPLPDGFTIGNGTYYDLSTTATFSGYIEICITYDEASLTVPEASLRLKHWETEGPDHWRDITYSLNTATNTICGLTTHFSPFVIAKDGPTAVGDGAMPRTFALHQNVPNPFNPSTTIAYDVPAGGGEVSIRVYDAAGRLVRTLVEGQRPQGAHTATWDGRDESGNAVSSGVYFYKMVAGSFVESKRMVLLK